MKQDRGDWMDVMRRKLGEADPSLPEGGWERLERELNAPASGVQTSPRKIWVKFAAAAAVVLVCVSIGVRVIRSDKNVLERVVMVSDATVSEQNTGAEGEKASVPVPIFPSKEVAAREILPGKTAGAVPAKKSSWAGSAAGLLAAADVSAADDKPVAMEYAESPAEPESSEVISRTELSETESAALPEIKSSGKRISTPETVYQTADYDGLFASSEPVTRQRTGGSFGISAGGIVTSAGSSTWTGPTTLLMNVEGAAFLREAYSDFSYEHRQPLSFGVTFRKEFKYGLSLESGLTYTLLRSDVTVPNVMGDLRQKLHFIGIPLRVNWEFLRLGGFSFYVGAGGMAEKCVSARFGSEKVEEKKIQWSVFGAVGAQYRLGKTVAIYFEPEVSHYLTETTLRTTYTDSPVSLNLQLGLRFNY